MPNRNPENESVRWVVLPLLTTQTEAEWRTFRYPFLIPQTATFCMAMDAKRNSSFAARIKNGVRNMRSTFNILFYVNKSKEKNGVVPVMGRVTINGTQSHKPTVR